MQPGDVFIIETPGGGGFGKVLWMSVLWVHDVDINFVTDDDLTRVFIYHH